MSETSGAPPAAPPLRLADVVRYALPAAPIGFATLLFQIYFPKYATVVLLLPPATLGWMLPLARIWDAASDPAIGHLSDLTRSRLGRRRPWMLAGCVPFGAAFAWLWSPPQGLDGAALALGIGVALLVFCTSLTMVDMTHTALGAELSPDYHERTRIFGVRRVLLGAGSLATEEKGRLWLEAAIAEKVGHVAEIHEQFNRRRARQMSGYGACGKTYDPI